VRRDYHSNTFLPVRPHEYDYDSDQSA
jgi:hypothetical protein